MSKLSFIGSYSGIDQGTIDKLMEAEKMPLVQMAKKKTSMTDQQNAWKDINTRLNSLAQRFRSLQSSGTFTSKKVSSTNEDFLSATAGNSATAGRYKIHVEKLATGTSVVGSKVLKEGQDNNTDLEINGTFTINLDLDDAQLKAKYLEDNKLTEDDITNSTTEKGKLDKYISDYKEARTVKVTNFDSLNEIAEKINSKSKETGVNAVIIGGRLSLAHKETGEEKKINLKDIEGSLIEGENDHGDPDKTSLGLGTGAERTDGTDAIFYVNDVRMTSDTNSVKDALEGVTINLNRTHDVNDYDTINISTDNSVLIKAVEDFVEQYNSTMTFIEDQLEPGDPEVEGSRGKLAGDSSLMRLHASLRKLVTSRVTNDESGYRDISELGVTTIDKFGKLEFDSSKLTKALSENPDGVKDFFYGKEGNRDNGFGPKLMDCVNSFITGDKNAIETKTNSLEKSMKDLDKQIENFNARMVKKEEYYVKMFSALDIAMMKAEDQMSWLQGQVDAMNTGRR